MEDNNKIQDDCQSLQTDVSSTLQWCYNYVKKQKESDEKTALIKHLIECGVS